MAQHKRGLQGAIWFTLACTTIDMDGVEVIDVALTSELLYDHTGRANATGRSRIP